VESEIPPTDAAVKVSDKLMMDLTEKISRNLHLKSLTEMQAEEADADQSFSKAIMKNIQSNDDQINRFAKQVRDEVSELVRLDKAIVRKSFEDRHDFLLIEGKLQGVDTTRQRSLLREVSKIWEKSIETGIKPDYTIFIDACDAVVKKEK
jgi:hypothetical protein